MSVSWNIDDHTGDVLRALESKIPTALEACGLQAENYAKQNLNTPKPHKSARPKGHRNAGDTTYPSVDTGVLVNSITHTQDGDRTEIIGSDIQYAPYVELGTQRAPAYPYLKPAVADHVDEYRQIIERYLSN